MITAADVPVGARFAFLQSQFDVICSDLDPFPVARAVVASGAVPVLMSPVVIRNYAGRCGYAPPAWIHEEVEARDTTSRRFHIARVQESYLDADKRPYVHLVDGGIADNVGLRTLLAPALEGQSFWQTIRERGLDGVRHVVVIVVDAETAPSQASVSWEWNPSLAQVVDAVTDAQIRLYSYETIDLLRSSFERWEREHAFDDAAPDHPVSFHIVHVAFEAHPDARTREHLNSLPSTLSLDEKDVDLLRRSARQILEESVEFRRVLDVLDSSGPRGGAPTADHPLPVSD